MNLQRPYGPHDEPTQPAGDPYFLGVDERRAPNQLEPGLACYGQNLRFRKGKAETRRGVLLCPWMKADGRTPWTEVYGGVVFSDPNQAGDWFIIAADGGVWKTRPNMTAQPVPLPSGVILTADTFEMFVPNTDGGTGVLVLLRGETEDPLVCVNLDAGFSAVPAGIVRNMPRSSYGLNHLNRLLLIEGKDIVAASDILAYNEFIPVQNEFRINPGNSQALVALQPLSNATLICFKTQSVLAITGLQNTVDENGDPGLAGNGPEPVSESYGLAGKFAKVRKGSNCYWVTNEPSVTSLRLTEQNETQDTDVRLSDPLSTTFGRINSLYLEKICVETWEGKLYVALPLDDAGVAWTTVASGAVFAPHPYNVTLAPFPRRYYFNQGNATSLQYHANGADQTLTASGYFTPETGWLSPVSIKATINGPLGETWTGSISVASIACCNAVAVFDFVNGAWCGVDESAGVFQIVAFLKSPFLGRQRLFLLGADGTIRLYEEGYEDEVLDAEGAFAIQPITTILRSRGYQLSDADRSRTLAAACRLRTWDPSYTLQTLNQGYNTNATEQADQTRDRTKYATHDTADWLPSNDNDDHANPGREDYSVTTNEPAGVATGSGLDVSAHQVSTDRVALSNVGDWQQIQLTNNRGRLELLQVTVEQQTTERLSGVNIV